MSRCAGSAAELPRGRGAGAGALDLARRLVLRPGDPDRRTHEPPLDEGGRKEGPHVVEEGGRRHRRPVLVARPHGQGEQPLGARGAHVEEVALALAVVGAGRQVEARDGGQDAPLVVGQKRLGRPAAGELALLEPAHEHRREAARAHALGRGELHRVEPRAALGSYGHAGEQVVDPLPVEARVVAERREVVQRRPHRDIGPRVLALGGPSTAAARPCGAAQSRSRARSRAPTSARASPPGRARAGRRGARPAPPSARRPPARRPRPPPAGAPRADRRARACAGDRATGGRSGGRSPPPRGPSSAAVRAARDPARCGRACPGDRRPR